MKDLITQLAIGVGLTDVTEEGGEGSLQTDVRAILTAIIGVLGFACVVVMIIGGVNYMTSSGDTGKVKKAKDTILYGLIGLIVCVLAFAIVQFVIGNILVDK